ncbi:formate dehydrogenase accessory protein FdhE, partial [Escherichia coli]
QARFPAPAVPDAADQALRSEHGMPPLSRHSLEADPDLDASLLALLAELDLSTAPEASAAARDALRAASREDRLDLAVQVFEGALPVDRIAECV